jgi:hypothetical protein
LFSLTNQNASPHEVGVVGPVAFQSDYGERYNLTPMEKNGNRNNSLYKFFYKAEQLLYPDTYFNDHFKLRSYYLIKPT